MLLCLKCRKTLPLHFFDNNKKNSHRMRKHHECYICRKANRIRLRGTHKNKIETLTWIQCWEVYDKFKGQCFKCKMEGRLTIDHHNNESPLSLSNAVLLCNGCNAKKAKKKPNVFYSETQLNELVFQFKIEPIRFEPQI
jgi:hypothetical protein